MEFVVKVIIGNKIDLPAVVSADEVQQYAKEKGMRWYQTSCKLNEGVQVRDADVIARRRPSCR